MWYFSNGRTFDRLNFCTVFMSKWNKKYLKNTIKLFSQLPFYESRLNKWSLENPKIMESEIMRKFKSFIILYRKILHVFTHTHKISK